MYVIGQHIYIHTHFKKFGPCKTLTVSKHYTNISSYNYQCGILQSYLHKAKTGQVEKSYM